MGSAMDARGTLSVRDRNRMSTGTIAGPQSEAIDILSRDVRLYREGVAKRLAVVAGSFAGGCMIAVVWSSDGHVEQIDEVHLGTDRGKERTRAQNLTRGEGTEGPHADATAGGAQQLETTK
jgi:hypothetical protein